MTKSSPTNESLLVEYEGCLAAVLHYDNYKWGAGSFLIAGVFIFWGAVFSGDANAALFLPGSLIVTLVLAVWLMYAEHNRQIYMLKLHRVWEIESLLGMVGNLRFRRLRGEAFYHTIGIRGHELDRLMFFLLGVGGPALAYVSQGFRWWQLAVIGLVVAGIGWVRMTERKFMAYFNALPPNATEASR